MTCYWSTLSSAVRRSAAVSSPLLKASRSSSASWGNRSWYRGENDPCLKNFIQSITCPLSKAYSRFCKQAIQLQNVGFGYGQDAVHWVPSVPDYVGESQDDNTPRQDTGKHQHKDVDQRLILCCWWRLSASGHVGRGVAWFLT